jgi:hypothetical protein
MDDIRGTAVVDGVSAEGIENAAGRDIRDRPGINAVEIRGDGGDVSRHECGKIWRDAVVVVEFVETNGKAKSGDAAVDHGAVMNADGVFIGVSFIGDHFRVSLEIGIRVANERWKARFDNWEGGGRGTNGDQCDI